MNGNIGITVLMTVYNGGGYLRQSVQSVLEQTFRDFEFLIINDCSTDDSLATIESFHDERIKIHSNAMNLGQTKSLNVGLKLAKGDYIARIDADDVALPQWLGTQVDKVKERPGCSVASSYAFVIDEHNKIKKVYKPPFEREDIILRSLIASPINHVGCIFKKKDILENGGYDEEYITAADYSLWGKLLRKGLEITTTPKILMAIREHVRSLSRSNRGKRELEEIEEVVGKNIGKFVDAKFTDHEISLFCRTNYDEKSLTDAEFSQAVEVIKKVYMNLVPSLNVRRRKIMQWTRKRCITVYLKRILSLINQRDYHAARGLSLKGIKEFGPLSIFTMFWAVSFLNGALIFIPGLYNKILRKKACLQLGIRLKKIFN